MKNKLCFTTYVYGWYQDFIPTFIYSILQAFPQHYVKIFLEEPLEPHNQRCLDLIKTEISDRFEVIDNFHDCDKYNLPHKAANRFVLGREYFTDFDLIYIGDVDFLIYNQFNDNFYETYLAHAASVGLPFSNKWNYDFGRYRMTGLHFVIKDLYFDQMDRWIEEMKYGTNDFKIQCPHHPQWPSYDEEMLYYMTFHAFDLRPLIGYYRPYHGLHFGTFRSSMNNSIDLNHVNKSNIDQWVMDSEKINPVLNGDLLKTFTKSMNVQAKRAIKIAQSFVNKKMWY